MKFAKILKNICIAMIVLAVVSSARRSSSRSKSKVTADEHTQAGEIINYEANLFIKSENQLNDYKIRIDQDSFNHMDYGIQFTATSGAINAPGFFSLGGHRYLFDFKEANEFNCLDEATFTNSEMYFSVPVQGKDNQNHMNDVVFTFPNGWAFGQQVNILAICNKCHERWNRLRTKREDLRQQIMKLFSHINMVEDTRQRNIKTREQLKIENNQIQNNIVNLNHTINTQREKIETIDKKINVIAKQQDEESAKLQKINDQIKNNQEKIKLQQEFIDSTSGKINHIRHVSQEEIDNEWASFKVNLKKMIDIHSNEDKMKKDLQGYYQDPKGNADRIMKTLDY